MTLVQNPPGQHTPVTPRRLEWLAGEVRRWQSDGLVDEPTATAILGSYTAVRRFSLGRLMLNLGGAFVGIGAIWLVAANLDSISPIVRFGLATAFWLGLVGAAHVVAERRTARGLTAPSPIVGTLRGAATLAYGAVIFQAAQSLQVPAYEASLVGFWALGALLYAYAVRGLGPLLIGLATGLVWFVWQVGEASNNETSFVLSLLVAAAALSAVGVLHGRGLPRSFGTAWREVGVLVLLIGLFAAALPVPNDDYGLGTTFWVAVGVAVLLAGAAVLRGAGTERFEPLAAIGVGVVGTLLVLWDPDTNVDRVGAEDWAHAVIAVLVYVVVAAWIAALGIIRDSERLTWLALAALVVFTTAQSFSVFAQVVDGAWLFLVLGLVFLGSGFLFDRGRRELEATLEGDAS